jgi:hypothetical protein
METEIYNPEFQVIGGPRPAVAGEVSWEKEIDYIDGIWDLLMAGAGRTGVEQRYQRLTDGPAVETRRFGGLIVTRPDGKWCEILEYRPTRERLDKSASVSGYDYSDHYYPTDALPSDAVLVVRTSALHDLEALITEPERTMDRPLEWKERATLLVIIAALAKLAKVDIDKPSKAAVAIESQIALMGAHMGVRTIEVHLNRIRDALERKGAED